MHRIVKGHRSVRSFLAAKKEHITSVSWNPEVVIKEREITYQDTPGVIASKKKFPLRFCRTVEFNIVTTRRTFHLTIPAFNYDGCTILKVFEPIIGKRTDKKFRLASAVHDYICLIRKNLLEIEWGNCSPEDLINLSTELFYKLLVLKGVSSIKAGFMSTLVYIWQRYVNYKAWTNGKKIYQ